MAKSAASISIGIDDKSPLKQFAKMGEKIKAGWNKTLGGLKTPSAMSAPKPTGSSVSGGGSGFSMPGIDGALSAVGQQIKAEFSSLVGYGRGAFDYLKGMMGTSLFGPLTGQMQDFFAVFSQIKDRIANLISKFLQESDFIKTATAIFKTASDYLYAAGMAIIDNMPMLFEIAKQIFDVIAAVVQGIYKTVLSFFQSDFFKAIANFVLDAVANIIYLAKIVIDNFDTIKQAAQWAFSFIGQVASGIRKALYYAAAFIVDTMGKILKWFGANDSSVFMKNFAENLRIEAQNPGAMMQNSGKQNITLDSIKSGLNLGELGKIGELMNGFSNSFKNRLGEVKQQGPQDMMNWRTGIGSSNVGFSGRSAIASGETMQQRQLDAMISIKRSMDANTNVLLTGVKSVVTMN